MSHSGRTQRRAKACPNCGLVQDAENWTCEECNFPEHLCTGCHLRLADCTCLENRDVNDQ